MVSMMEIVNEESGKGQIDFAAIWHRAYADIVKTPTIDAESVVHAKWIKMYRRAVRCSNCGYVVQDRTRTKYCSWCGAEMEWEVK